MKNKILDMIDKANLKKEPITKFAVGDTVKVSVKIKEGEKERTQAYSGIVIARKGSGPTACFTVRRTAFGEGSERVFPIHSPSVASIEVESRGDVRRAKLYYLRDLAGKKARVKSKHA